MPTDFNDLAQVAGLDEVRRQLLDAIEQGGEQAAPPPAPTEEGDAGKSALDRALERYALIHGETKVFDHHDRQVIKKTAFQDLVTRPVAKAWLEHPERRTIAWHSVNALQEDNAGDGLAMLKRFAYIYPSKDAWDHELRDIVPLEALRSLYPRDYTRWMEHPGRRVIQQDQLVFDPTERSDPDTTINTFTGLPLTPRRARRHCDGILQVLDWLCNSDEDVIEWVTRWLAYPLQHVGAKLDTALLFHSEVHGSGKSMLFADLMPRIYGRYGAVLGQHQLESQYTDWRSRMLFGCFEEVLSRDQKYSQIGTIKHLITGKTQRIEKKFISGWEEANHLNAVFLSNEFQPFPLEPHDRRFMVVWPEHSLPDELQMMYNTDMNNGGAEAFYGYLLDVDLGDFHPHIKPMMTKAKERLIEFGLPSWEVFYREWEAGNLDAPYQTCLTGDLHKAYKRFCSVTGDHPMTLTKFATILSARLEKQKNRHYNIGVRRKQGTFFIVGSTPEGKKDADWLGECVSNFRSAMNDPDDGGPF